MRAASAWTLFSRLRSATNLDRPWSVDVSVVQVGHVGVSVL
jgi:hypothetical protein